MHAFVGLVYCRLTASVYSVSIFCSAGMAVTHGCSRHHRHASLMVHSCERCTQSVKCHALHDHSLLILVDVLTNTDCVAFENIHSVKVQIMRKQFLCLFVVVVVVTVVFEKLHFASRR